MTEENLWTISKDGDKHQLWSYDTEGFRYCLASGSLDEAIDSLTGIRNLERVLPLLSGIQAAEAGVKLFEDIQKYLMDYLEWHYSVTPEDEPTVHDFALWLNQIEDSNGN